MGVDCPAEENEEFCYGQGQCVPAIEDQTAKVECQELPRRPHAPIIKGFRGGAPLGETLYNPNEIEPHMALELIERSVRLSLFNMSSGKGSDDEDDDDEGGIGLVEGAPSD